MEVYHRSLQSAGSGPGALRSAVHGADPDGGSGYVGFVDDLAYRDLTAEQFAELMPQGDNDPTFLLLADEGAVMDKEYPILVLDLYEEGRGRSFRVNASELWPVGANLSIGNRDFEEFADP
ncbi:DUF6924 domain-containing protein [Streptomyces sp. NPDC014864]|uniref:DUF6924 domain-containing protein n=1 Tax=Streptomyces sp. NPDC014864 TaxID=3364924 RepID=UPI0036FE7F53